jgi:hypothetical protein
MNANRTDVECLTAQTALNCTNQRRHLHSGEA